MQADDMRFTPLHPALTSATGDRRCGYLKISVRTGLSDFGITATA